VTSRLGTGNSLTFFTVHVLNKCKYQNIALCSVKVKRLLWLCCKRLAEYLEKGHAEKCLLNGEMKHILREVGGIYV